MYINSSADFRIFIMPTDEERRRQQEYDDYNWGVRQAGMAADAASQQIEINCAQKILSGLMEHVDAQMERYPKGDPKYQNYSQIKDEIKAATVDILLTKPHADEREKNINNVINIIKKTGEASQERRHSLWDAFCQFITGNKKEIKSWSNFKSTMDDVKEKMNKERQNSDPHTLSEDYAKNLSKATNDVVQELGKDSSSQHGMK